jgi:alkylhydroperoxidase family enzyme
MSPRIEPAKAPYPEFAAKTLVRLMPPGVPPLTLFTTLARDERLFSRFMGGGLLDKGHLSLRQREIVIHRITAKCRSEYEWGVHMALFADRVGFTPDQRVALVDGEADASCWTDQIERDLIAFCDELNATCDVRDARWSALKTHLGDMAMMEIVMLCGFYRTVSYLTNALRLEPESYAARFPAKPMSAP